MEAILRNFEQGIKDGIAKARKASMNELNVGQILDADKHRPKPLLGCPFCGATPEKMGNTTSAWVPHKRGCFLRPAALSELGQVRWNVRQRPA